MTPEIIFEINESLQELGADFKIDMTVEVPVEVSIDGAPYESHLKMRVTKGGYEIENRKKQLRRIVQEIRGRVT